jgi:hypothetical protein
MRSQIVAGSEALQISVQTLKTGTTALRSNSETLQAGSRALQSNNETIKDGNTTLQEDQILSSRLELAVQAQNAFGDLKYWLTDLAVSWLNESEENADTANERLAAHLELIAAFAPKRVEFVLPLIETVNEVTLEAVDAYVDENRVLGNSLLAKARDSMLAVDTNLAELASELRQRAEQAKKSALANAEAALAPAAKAVSDAEAAIEPAQNAVRAAGKAVATGEAFVARANRATQISIGLIMGAIALAVALIRVLPSPINAKRRSASNSGTKGTSFQIHDALPVGSRPQTWNAPIWVAVVSGSRTWASHTAKSSASPRSE